MSVGVMFAIDSTGSMRWVHRELCENIGTILLQFEDEGIPARFSLVGFRDYIADSTNWIEFMDFADEEEIDELANWLDRLKAKGGGGNDGESSIAGAVYGIQECSWPDVRRKVIAIFTDDHPHVPDIDVDSWAEFHEILRMNEIEQVHLFVNEKHVDGFDNLDSHGYDVIRYTLIKNNRDALEDSIRKFVKISSTPFDSEIDIIEREESVNPFDMDDEETIYAPEEAVHDPDANPFDDY